MLSPIAQKLAKLFSKFPTVGPRTASRFVFYLIGLKNEEFDDLMQSLAELRQKSKICAFCSNPFESQPGSLCPICSNNSRDKSQLCIVEKEIDLIAIEKTKKYKGLYFILGGVISNFKKEKTEEIKSKEFEERIVNPDKFGLNSADFKEIIIALNPTSEGQTTSLFLERKLKSISFPENKPCPKITRLGRGLPIGGELEYADEETLENAFEGRK